MLKGNLATRPFYNERLVSLLIAGLAALVFALSLFNGLQLWNLTRERATLAEQTSANQAEAVRIRQEAAAEIQRADNAGLAALAADSREANSYLNRRAFSWTNFFAFIERTLPRNVRLISVTPGVDDNGNFQVVLVLVARDPDDLDDLVESMLDTGRFYDVFPPSVQANPDGTFGVLLQASYLPAIDTGSDPSQPASGGAE